MTRVRSYLQALDQVCVRPADLLREASEHAEAAAGRHLDHLKSVGHYHTLLLVVGSRDALEALQHPGQNESTAAAGHVRTAVSGGRVKSAKTASTQACGVFSAQQHVKDDRTLDAPIDNGYTLHIRCGALKRCVTSCPRTQKSSLTSEGTEQTLEDCLFLF